jgi:hypothetical protein
VTKNLKMRVELAVGMKAMVVLNIATEADLANGTRGVVKGFVLDPREDRTTPDGKGNIHLKYPPPVICFQPNMQTNAIFEGIPRGIIPISPSMVRFSVDVDGERVKLERRQLAIVPGYAFTDYKAQGPNNGVRHSGYFKATVRFVVAIQCVCCTLAEQRTEECKDSEGF